MQPRRHETTVAKGRIVVLAPSWDVQRPVVSYQKAQEQLKKLP